MDDELEVGWRPKGDPDAYVDCGPEMACAIVARHPDHRELVIRRVSPWHVITPETLTEAMHDGGPDD